MSEELRIEVDVKAKDDNARKTLDGLIKEYNDKPLEFQVKLGRFDISEISSSIARLTSDLNKLTNIEFNGLNKLETNLKNINKLMSQQNKISNTGTTIEGNTENGIKRLVGDQKESLNQIKELEQIGKEMDSMLSQYNKNNEMTFKEFAKKNEDALGYIDVLKNSSTDKAFQNVLKYKEKLDQLQKEFSTLGVKATGLVEKTFEMDSGKIGVHKHNGGYEDVIGQTSERFDEAVEQARKLSPKISAAKANINKYLDQVSDDEKEIFNQIEKLQKSLIPVESSENRAFESQLKSMLENYLSLDDLKDLNLNIPTDLFKGYDKFIKNIKEMKQEYNDTFKDSDDFVEIKLFDNIQKAINNVDKSVEGVNLNNLKEKLTNAFDIDESIISNIEKIEGALKQLNNMSELTQKSLFTEGTLKTGTELALDNKVKEYLELDKSINNALTKLSKAEFNNSSDTANALNQEIELLKQKQALVTMDLRSNGGLNDDLREQIKLQEQLNKAISQVEQAEFKDNNINKLQEQALKMNQEFDEMAKKQKEIASFEMPEILDTKGIKSYVDYLDSAADGIKRILTQSSNTPGKDLTTTIYGDGTEVRKVVNNIEKSVNQLSTAYKQVDNELARLIKSKEKLESIGDTNTAQLLEKQISSWKEMQSGIENAAKSAKVYDQVMEKVQNTLAKNQNSIDVNKSQLEFKLDVNNENAVRKVEEFKTKTLSNLQELERKYKGTQMFDQVTKEVEKFKNELKGLDTYLENVENADISHLSGEFRRINQDLTQTKRDMNDLNKTMKNNFFDDLYDSMRTFTLGNIIGDAIQNGAYAIKDTIVGLDSSLRDMMKVAPTSFEGTAEQLKGIKNDAVDVAKVVGQSSEDVIQGMAKALQTGARTMQDALEIAKSSATFANVGDLSQEQADTYIASIMSAYGGMNNALQPVRDNVQGMGQDYNNLTKFLDLANHAGNNFAISTGDVGEALMRSGSILSEFGVSMQDAISMIVGANESVQDAEKVGTAIKTMATNLGGVKAAAKDGTVEMNRTAKALKEIAGIDVYSDKQTGEIKDMMTILKELNVVWDDLSQDKQLAIAESIAGKNHINTLMAMLGNWDTVLQFQEEYNNGFTVASAQREQERYLDSIEGKWNALKENLKNLVTTTISSDFAKGFLDGAISFTDGLNTAFKSLDKINAVLPATIGLVTALGQSFKVLSGNGSVDLFGANTIKTLNEALKGDTVNFSATSNAISKLSSGQVNLSKSTTKTSDAFKKYKISIDGVEQNTLRINRANTNLVKNQTQVNTGMKGVISSFTKTAAGSKLAMVGTTLLNGALVGLAAWGIGEAVKAFDEYINRHEIAAKAARDSIDTINGEMQGYQSQKKSLGEIATEYDNLASKTNKTASEIERFSQLKNEIANIMPELVLGYDSNNDPILAMSGNVTDLISELDRAIESKQRLLESKEGDLGINATENIKKAVKELDSSFVYMQNALKGGSISSNNALSDKNFFGDVDIKKRAEKVVKALEDEERAYTERYNQHLNNLEEYNAREQEIQKKNLNELFKNDKYKSLEDNLKGNVNSFAAMFDWGEYDLSGQRQMVRGMEELSKSVSEGKIDLEDFNNKWRDINSTFQNTGDIDQYNKSIGELAKELESATGIESSNWVEGLSQQFEGLSYADAKLNKFLQSYNSSLDQLRNGDSIAIALKKQFDELANFSDLISSEIISTGKISYEPLLEVKESESFKYLPQQIQTLIDGIISDKDVTEAEQDILLRLNTIIQNEGALSDDVAQQLNRIFTGNATEQDLEIGVKIGDYEIPPDLVKILNDEYKDKNIGIDFTVNTDGIDKLEEAKKTQEEMNGKSTESTHTQKVEGKEDLEESKESQNEQDGKVTESVHKVESDGADEVKSDIDSINEKAKELEEPKNLTINNGELQGSVDEFSKLIEYSTKLKDGEYQINFKSDTADAIAQIENLKLAINNLSNQFAQIPSTTITLNTSLAAQNISGLLVRIDQVKAALGTLSSKDVKINTALSAQNLSGLILRVQQYTSAINGVTTKTVDIATAQAAKNVSGLIAKINEYNGVNPKTLTFKTNASTVTSQINTLASSVRNVPTSKTIKFNISQSGSVPSASSFTRDSLVSPISDFGSQIQSDTLGIQRSIREGLDTATSSIPTTLSTPRATIKTPIAISGNDIQNAMKYSINLLKELEARLESVGNEISILDKKMKHATNSEKLKYLEEQNKLYQENISVLSEQSDALQRQKNYYEYFLKNKGFTFNIDGNMTNYEEKLLAMEKEKERLDKLAEDKQKASSDYSGKDDKKKDSLSKAYDEAKKKADEYGESLTEIKKYADEYYKVAFTELPNVTEEFIDINNAIKDNINSIKEFELEIKKLKEDSRYKDENRDVSEVQNKLDKNQIELETAVGKERERLLKERIELQKQLKKEAQDLLDLENQRKEGLKGELGQYGFTFREDSSIEGYGQKIEELKNSLTEDEFDKVFSMVEDYIDTTYDKIPDLENELLEMGNTIKDTISDLENVKIEQIDRDIERADEDELLGLLQEKKKLQDELVDKKQEYIDLLKKESEELTNTLSEQGINFDSEGNMLNYEQKIKELQDALNNTSNAKEKEKIKKELEELIKNSEKYVKVTESEIPKAVEEWKDAQHAVKETSKEIEDIEKAQAKFAEDKAKAVRKATEDIMKVTQDLLQTQMNINRKQIDMLEKSMKLASFDVTGSYEALEKQISLLEKQIDLQTQMNKEIDKQKDYYKNRLVSFGIEFDDKGIATNAEKVLDKIKKQMANASDADELDKLEEKFNDIVDVLGDYNSALESIVDGQGNLMDLQLEIQGVYENMLETTKKIEDKITSILEKQVEERKKLIDEELKKRLDAINKEKDAYNEKRKEDKYQKEYDEKLKELSDIQAKIEAVSKDTSLAGQKKLAELLEEFNKKQEEFDEMVQDKLDEEINSAFDKENDRIQEEADKAKEDLDSKLEKEELYETIKDALESGKLQNIDGTVTDLKDALIEYENKYGDGLSVIGGLIKKDLLSQLDISLDTMKNIEKILKNLNISDFYNTSAMSIQYPNLDSNSYSTVSNRTVQFNESLITVQGNVTSDVMPDLKKALEDAERRITTNIINAI